jgi:hypothetical protein
MSARTPYDDQTVCEPTVWVHDGMAGTEDLRPASDDDHGRVDFDLDEVTFVNVRVRPGQHLEIGEEAIVEIETVGAEEVVVLLDGAPYLPAALEDLLEEARAAAHAVHESRDAEDMDEVFDARDQASDVLAHLIELLTPKTEGVPE